MKSKLGCRGRLAVWLGLGCMRMLGCSEKKRDRLAGITMQQALALCIKVAYIHLVLA